ncbi:hypothetical protein MN608_07475 [Microdochium nivale]|nr:hypothetical protein MN608_07475 [Microdochium nivale]
MGARARNSIPSGFSPLMGTLGGTDDARLTLAAPSRHGLRASYPSSQFNFTRQHRSNNSEARPASRPTDSISLAATLRHPRRSSDHLVHVIGSVCRSVDGVQLAMQTDSKTAHQIPHRMRDHGRQSLFRETL